MARTHHQQYLYALKRANEQLTNLFLRLAADIREVLIREQLPSGIVPKTRSAAIREEVGQLVTRLFLRPTAVGELAPYTVVYGRVTPMSPYFASFWQGVTEVTRIAVDQQAFYMRRALSDAPDVLGALEHAPRNPFEAARQVAEFSGFTPRPFLAYDPLHRFVDERGYDLSARIWRITGDTRRKLDLFMAEAIAEGRGALDIAAELEQFLHPDRVLKRTNKPYGTNASYDAMRLARTEITAAHSRAGLMSAHMNPFVTGVDWVRSTARRPCTSGVCDDLEAGSPYTLQNVPNIPGDSHPHCMCHYRWRFDSDTSAVIEDLRGMIGQPGSQALFILLVGPLLVDQFVRWLLDDPSDLGVVA